MEQREIPGLVPRSNWGYVYFAQPDKRMFRTMFRSITPLMKERGWLPASGGIGTENTSITLPDGRQFFCLAYKGDLEGWRTGILAFAREKGLTTAEIADGVFRLDDGTQVPLSECTAEFYREL
jgi:hypothetical protein